MTVLSAMYEREKKSCNVIPNNKNLQPVTMTKKERGRLKNQFRGARWP